MLPGHVSGQLDEQALRAQSHVQRVRNPGLVDPIGRDAALAERRLPQIDEWMCKIRAAQATHMR